MQCQFCSARLPDQARYCNVCGTQQTAVKTCPQCGARQKPGQQYCAQCGAAVGVATKRGQDSIGAAIAAWGAVNLFPALIGLLAFLTVIACLTGILLLRQQNERRRADERTALATQWQAAQVALTAGDPEKALGLITDIRLRDANFEPTAVKSLRIAACMNMTQAAEGAADISAAQKWWDCVLEEDAASSAGRRGHQAAGGYLTGQAAWNVQDFAGAIAAWQSVYEAQPAYADLKTKLYDAYIAYGDALCAQRNLQDGQAQFATARNIDVNRPEADAHLASCQPAPTPTPTLAPIPSASEKPMPPTPSPTPIPTPTSRPAPTLCFEPRVRHYEEHKGCCAEVAGLVYNLQGKQFGPRGALVRIEGPPATNRYVREFGVDAGGGYSITALTVDTYTIWLKGTNIRSPKFEVKYPDWAKIRILVDFYQVVCH